MQNRQVAAIFNELADLLEIEGENPFKVRAYRNAARTIEGLGDALEDMIDRGEDLTKLPGIGEDLAEKIVEIVRTGKLSKLEEVRKEVPDSLRALLSIEGLGPKRVKTLWETLHITDPDTLKKAAEEHKIRELPGFGPKTEENILKGMHLLKQEGIRFLFAEAEAYAIDLKAFLQKAPGLHTVEVAGSFRRRKETVGDLDILCTAAEPQKVINYFIAYDKVVKVISAGSTRSTVILQNALQVDLRVVEQKSYGAALQYFTGSKSHSIALRKIAVDMGLKINEYGVFRGDKVIAGKTEEEVYASIGLRYIEPELRENRGEIEAARDDTLPRLVTLEDIRGDLHMHTTYSDGLDTIEAMVQKAISLNYDYIAVTDHSATLAVVKGLDTKKAAAYLEEIEKLNSRYEEIHIFKGMEVDILEEGKPAMDDAVLDKLDIALGAVHANFKLSGKEQTKRVLKAIRNPHIKGIAHPTGRLIGKREPLALDMDEIYKAIREEGKFLEINAQPERLDLNDVLIREAKEAGVMLAVNTDAHAAGQLEYMRYGINQARRGWLEKGDLINTLPLGKLLQVIGKG
ncbi:MAG TPA: DNA polymerase/3'-5' exonuclease PolX [Campylobacteraceae bacterium]|nr:DNA polymerase/3'-5' exonuclease PolX [Campylobacteraceae bacterium]